MMLFSYTIWFDFIVSIFSNLILCFLSPNFPLCVWYSYNDTSSRRKQPDRSKRSHHRRSPTSSRHGHRQRHRDERADRDERSHSTSRRRHRDRVVKDRSPVKVKTIWFLFAFQHTFGFVNFVYSIFGWTKEKKKNEPANKNWNMPNAFTKIPGKFPFRKIWTQNTNKNKLNKF